MADILAQFRRAGRRPLLTGEALKSLTDEIELEDASPEPDPKPE